MHSMGRSIARMPNTANRRRVSVLVGRFPCLSETFIRNEIHALQQQGYAVEVISCAPRERSDVWLDTGLRVAVRHGPSGGPVRVLLSLLRFGICHPVSMARLLCVALTSAPLRPQGMWLAMRAIDTACYFTAQLQREPGTHLHAHYLHLPALVARMMARLWRVSYSVSAHAHDVFVAGFRAGSLCREARFVAVCSQHAHAHLERRLPPDQRGKLAVVHHGIPLSHFRLRTDRTWAGEDELRLLTVCRLVRKKGVDVVLRALAVLQSQQVCFTYRIVGSGPEHQSLRDLSAQLGLRAVEFLGAQTPRQVREMYAWADAFVLGCRTTANGDRDGVPNVILEAGASGVPIVVSNAGGVAEIVRPGETGWLVPAEDPQALADALQQLAQDSVLRGRIVRNARRLIEARFDISKNIVSLAQLLEREDGPECARYE